MPYDKRKLAELFSEMLRNTTDDPIAAEGGLHEVIYGAGTKIQIGSVFSGTMPEDGKATLFVLAAGLEGLHGFVNECLKDRQFATQIGAEPIAKRLRAVIQELWPPASNLDHEDVVKREILQKLREEVRNWSVRVPIANLKLAAPITIGNVRLVRHQDGTVANANMIIEHPDCEGFDRVSEKAAMLSIVAQIAQQGSAWAEVEIEAHEGRIIEVAKCEVELSISVIRAFVHAFRPYGFCEVFGLPYELAGAQTGFISKSAQGMMIHNDVRRVSPPLELSEQELNLLKTEFAFDELSRIVGAEWDKLNSLERAVRVSLLWLSRSVIAQTEAEALTHATIALERLLILDGEETTVERFADRLTYLLSAEVDERKAIHKAAKRLYDVRSKVVHSGFGSVERSQRQEMELLALRAFKAIGKILREVKNHEGLRELLHDRKMQ
ncbi:MAG: hypothetical protein JWP89_852 [Schlesneria sp.]|nr:hypothetical protein [Schlesneria sp.]